MHSESVLTLLQNGMLLLTFALVADRLTHRLTTYQEGLRKIILGIATGCIGLMLMLTPWELGPGIIFDTRSILMGSSGLFFGGVSTFIAGSMLVFVRILMGGSGVWMGVATILVTGGMGVAWRKHSRKNPGSYQLKELVLFGYAIHLAMFGCTAFLPPEARSGVVASILFPVFVIYPAGTVMLGSMVVARLARERDQAELHLREARLALAMDAGKIGFFDVNLATGENHISAEWKAQLGYEPEELKNSDINWESFLHPDDRDAALDLEKQWREGIINRYESQYRLRHKNGSWVWILARGQLERDSRGQPARIIGCHLDITALKEKEAARMMAERKFRSLADNSSDAIMLYDKDGRHRYVNPAGCAIADLEAGFLIGKTHEEAGFPKEESETRYKDIQEVILTGRPVSRIIHRSTNGPERIYDWRLSPLPGETGSPEMALGISRDITELLRVKEEMGAKERYFQSLIENAPDGVVLVGTDGTMRYASPAARVMFGYEGVDAFPDPETETHPEDLQRVHETITRLFREPDTHPMIEYRFRHRQKYWIWIESRFSIFNPENPSAGFVINFRDITERKEGEQRIADTRNELQKLLAESDLARLSLLGMVEDLKIAEEKNRRLAEELELRVRQRTADLLAANKELESFSYSVSHDLRSPLRAMDGFAHALLAEYRDTLDTKGIHYLQRIQEASIRMGQLINDLLELSRVTRTELVKRPVDLATLARNTLESLSEQEPHRQVEWKIQENMVFKADSHLLRIVIENLVGNAWKFTSHREKATLEIGILVSDTGERRCFVKDNGAGFDMAYVERLFAPFHRLHGSDEFPGTGIGIVTVQRIISRHGGRIWTEAEPDKGATFWFTLGDTL